MSKPDSRWRKLTLRAAGAVGGLVRGAPGVLGAASICVGLGLVYLPLAFLAAGAFGLIVDRRMP